MSGLAARRGVTGALLLLALVAAVFAPVRHYGFVLFDDHAYITENPGIREGLTPRSVLWAFGSTELANWHPLTWLSHMLDVNLFGRWAGGHHLTSVLLHAAAAVLLFLSWQGMTGAAGTAFLAAALFAIHPLHVESVAWVAERKDVLLGLCWMLVLVGYLRYVRKPGSARLMVVWGLYALALMAKPMGVTLPFVLLLLDWWPLGRWGHRRAGQRGATAFHLVREKLPLFVMSAASAVITYLVQAKGGAVASVKAFPLPTRLANALVSTLTYLVKTVWPRALAVYYPYQRNLSQPWRAWVAALLLTAVTVVVLAGARRRPCFATGWFWYLGTLVPVVGLVQVGEQAMADRYTYLPLVGIFLAAACGTALLKHPEMRRAAVVMLTLVILALAGAARRQVKVWRDDATLFGHAITVVPGNWLAHANLGLSRSAAGDEQGALAAYEAALGIDPRNGGMQRNAGNALVRLGRVDEAIPHYREALRLVPGDMLARFSLALALARLGEHEEAAAQLAEAVRRDPRFAEGWQQLGQVQAIRGRIAEAADAFRRAVEIKPRDALAHWNLAAVLAELGSDEEAERQYREAVRLNPSLAGAGEQPPEQARP